VAHLADVRPSQNALTVWLAVLALLIHFILLSTAKYNWIEGKKAAALDVAVTEMIG
jgi:light-harvesting complex 1 alpha chain